MTAPRTKRQFAGAAAGPTQRQITTYFACSPSNLSGERLPLNNTSAAASQVSLPADTQSSLLNVGMRIRKSVPEGYKTGSSYSGFKLWDEREDGTIARKRKVVSGTVAQRELMPFCGIHSVGGISSQPAFAPEADDVPGLTSSQESMESIFEEEEEVANVKKRGYVDDDGEDDVPLRLFSGGKDWTDGDVSPRTMAPVMPGNARVMAVPRRRGRKSVSAGAGLEDLGQENMAVDDFEEAAFLDSAVFGEEMDI
ncbi:hypothetical protein jhhlp_004079 [Lomentospora prolificans]|uniref:Uncharacterized protein n=1 Tax=Lomentospora prolificans TaxID=41688 RepID=A0A2N3NAJ8_9PEZI|nr:hypothetical protein jhhlp_004079 [Lomentospora prolificans]